MTDRPLIVHGTAVSYADRALMFIGPSGSGKSGFALQLMALGATLIADDRVILTAIGKNVMASCPENLSGLIEARGIGILNTASGGGKPLAAVVDLGQVEPKRHPDPRTVTYLDRTIPLLWRVDSPHFTYALLPFLAHGRSAR